LLLAIHGDCCVVHVMLVPYLTNSDDFEVVSVEPYYCWLPLGSDCMRCYNAASVIASTHFFGATKSAIKGTSLQLGSCMG